MNRISIIVILGLWLTATGLASCSASRASLETVGSASLPALPVDRRVDVATPSDLLGKDTWQRSLTGALDVGTALELGPQASATSWAIYRFAPGANPLQAYQLQAIVPGGSTLFAGLADYSSGRWEFSESASAPRLLGPQHLSPLGNVFLLLATFGSSTATVNKVTFVTDVAPALFSVSGQVTAGGSPLPGVQLSLTGQSAQTTTAEGSFSFVNVANGTYTLTPALAGYTFTPASRSVTVAGANVTAQDFTATQVINYTGSIKALLDSNCVSCHGAGSALGGVRLHTYALAKQNATKANAKIQDGAMPPTGALNAAQKALFKAWIDAGLPE